MSFQVCFEKSTFPDQLTNSPLPKVLLKLCRESAELFASLVRKNFLHRIEGIQFSGKALRRYPVLRNLVTFVRWYLDSIVVKKDGEQYTVLIDYRVLKVAGIPRDLSWKLEFGDPSGIPPLGHWRTAISQFEKVAAKQLSRKFLRNVLR